MWGMNISDIRRANLRKIIDVAIGQGLAKNDADYCNKHDLNASYLSQMLNGHRSIGEKSARSIEAKLNLNSGFLDKDDVDDLDEFQNTKLEDLISSLHKLDSANKLPERIIEMLQNTLNAVASIQNNQDDVANGIAPDTKAS